MPPRIPALLVARALREELKAQESLKILSNVTMYVFTISKKRCPVSGVPPWSRSREEKLPLPRGLEHFLNTKKGARFPPKPLKSLVLKRVWVSKSGIFVVVLSFFEIQNQD